jgi:hypothetical protein
LNEDRFLDGMSIEDIPGWVEVLETSGLALRGLLDAADQKTGVS